MILIRPAYRKYLLALALVVVLATVAVAKHPEAALTHPLGNFTINHYSRIELGAGQVNVHYVLDMAEIPAFQERARVDADRDGQITNDEKGRYLERQAPLLARELHLEVDGAPVPLHVVSQELDFPPGQGGLPTLRLHLLFRGDLASGTEGERVLRYRDDSYAQRLGWREIVVAPGEGVRLINSTAPQKDRTDKLRSYPQDLLTSPPDERQATATFAVKGGPASAGIPQPTSVNIEDTSRRADAFTSLISTEELSFPVVVLALGLALGLGAAHALSPGHGKTIIAAYMVGTRGTPWQAVFLGLTVTVSHTLGVLALGAVTLYASSIIAPESLYPWLGLTSGLIVLGIGIWLLVSPLRRKEEGHHHHHHGHSHHGNHHRHTFGITWRNLTALGVVGGLVPSVSALVILLAAVSLQRVGFGLLLIVAFSAGMAAVLAGAGLALVYAGRFIERTGPQSRRIEALTRRLPLAAALVVIISGVVLATRAAFQIGLV